MLAKFDDDQIDEYIQKDPDIKECDKCVSTLKLVKTTYKDEYQIKVTVNHIRYSFNEYKYPLGTQI